MDSLMDSPKFSGIKPRTKLKFTSNANPPSPTS